MRVLVCGGRDFKGIADISFLSDKLDNVHRNEGISLVIAGGQKGADFYAICWAKYTRVEFKEFPADWDTHGDAAGPIRNKQMLDEGKPDLVIAFPGGRGTADMVRQAKRAKVEVRELYP